MTEQVRITKYLSDCEIMSRRSAERAIADGRIYVNGEKAVTGQKISEDDNVTLDGKTVKKAGKKVYIMLNKPVKYVTSMSDEKGRCCVTELTENLGIRVYPVGRLDYMSEGLLIMTNDGEFANRLMHPRYGKNKEYELSVYGNLTERQIEKFKIPIEIDGKVIEPIEILKVRTENRSTVMNIVLHEGRNREIRNICKANNLRINYLKRVALGGVKLGNLEKGKWRYLTEEEVKSLTK